MRVTRSFCTSLWYARQALYEPYVAPLNQEQKKALRKVLARSMPTYHGRFNKDLQLLLQAYDSVERTHERRRDTLNRVNKIIQSAFGLQYSVIDRSMCNYAHDCVYAPLELAILDNSMSQGFPPNMNEKPLPEPYHHDVLAKLLQKHGFTGWFVAGDITRSQPAEPKPRSKLTRPVEERGPLPVNPPWPSYTPYPTVHLTYPPVLFAEHQSKPTQAFFLSPPVPTHVPLINLLREYTSRAEYVADLITVVFLWTRSINITELTPTCIALMVIGWLQCRKNLPNLQNPENSKDVLELADRDDGVWFRSERLVAGHIYKVTVSTWLETGFLNTSPYKPLRNIGPLLHDFLNFWSQHSDNSGFISSAHCLSVRDGGMRPRTQDLASTAKLPQVLIEDDQKIEQGYVPSSPNEQPTIWQIQPMVIQDPFVPSFNHAQSLSKATFDYFRWYCSLSVRTINRAHPLQTIFGPGLPPLKRTMSRHNRAYSSLKSLSRDIEMMYKASLPPEPVLEARKRTVSRVQQTIRRRFGDEYRVECFGSTMYGVGTATSDLDLVVIDQNRINGFSPQVNLKKLPAVYSVKQVARTLQKKGFTDVLAIPAANVPIVKFRDPTTGLDCDININDQLGLCNTRLVARYCDLAPALVRPMIMVVKRWAKSYGLNDPSGKNGPVTFSSYALVLMVIGYLQVKQALPNLQEGLPPHPKGDTERVFWTRTKKGQHVCCDTRHTRGDDWTPQRQLDPAEALVGWFGFWGHEFVYSEQLMSIRDGGVIQRSTKQKTKKKKKKGKEKENVNSHSDSMSELERWEQRRAEEEDAVLTAFANERDSDESEDTEGDEIEAITVNTDSEASNDDLAYQDRHSKAVTGPDVAVVDSDDIVAKGKEAELSPATQVGITEVESITPVKTTIQPAKWGPHSLIVADPFILNKNVCGNISKANIERFLQECRRSAQCLEWGMDLDGLMGPGDPVPGLKPHRGRRSRGGRGATGRGRGLQPVVGRGGHQTQPTESREEIDNSEGRRGHGSHRGGHTSYRRPAGRGVPADRGASFGGEQPVLPQQAPPPQLESLRELLH